MELPPLASSPTAVTTKAFAAAIPPNIAVPQPGLKAIEAFCALPLVAAAIAAEAT